MNLLWIKDLQFENYLTDEELQKLYIYGLDRVVYLLTKLSKDFPKVVENLISNLKEVYVLENYSHIKKSEMAKTLGIKSKDVKEILIKHNLMKEQI